LLLVALFSYCCWAWLALVVYRQRITPLNVRLIESQALLNARKTVARRLAAGSRTKSGIRLPPSRPGCSCTNGNSSAHPEH
jgi:hypothetical protein